MRPESAVPDSRDGVGPSGLQWVHPCLGKSTLSLGFSDLMSPSLVPGALTSQAKDSKDCCCTLFVECRHQKKNCVLTINERQHEIIPVYFGVLVQLMLAKLESDKIVSWCQGFFLLINNRRVPRDSGIASTSDHPRFVSCSFKQTKTK